MGTIAANERDAFGDALRALIAQHYPSQRAFAATVGMTPSRVSHLVQGIDQL